MVSLCSSALTPSLLGSAEDLVLLKGSFPVHHCQVLALTGKGLSFLPSGYRCNHTTATSAYTQNAKNTAGGQKQVHLCDIWLELFHSQDFLKTWVQDHWNSKLPEILSRCLCYRFPSMRLCSRVITFTILAAHLQGDDNTPSAVHRWGVKSISKQRTLQ